MIKFRDVSVRKNGKTILDSISLELDERRIGIIGRNGSGKSTLVRLVNGLEKPTEGTISIDGTNEAKSLRRKVGFVFQNPDNQIVYPIVREDIEFGLKNLKIPAAECSRRIDNVLGRFDLEHLQHRMVHELSGGEKQLVALAGVLVMEPEIIVFDEPTTLLDLWNTKRFMQAVRELNQHIILVTHDLDLLADFDRVILIENGRITRDGQPADTIARYRGSDQ